MKRKMNKGIILALAASQLLTGCVLTTEAVKEKKYWKVPVTAPADVVLFPAELCAVVLVLCIVGNFHK